MARRRQLKVPTEWNALMSSEISADQLQDLFVRCLYEDRQKAALIDTLTEQAKDTVALAESRALEPLIKEVLVALDRVLTATDATGYLASVADEILEVFGRRGLQRVSTDGAFDPRVHEALGRRAVDPDLSEKPHLHVVRGGFLFGDRLLRPAQLVLVS